MQKLSRPLEKNWPITQRFETKVTYMRSGIHSGIDWDCEVGTPLLACFDGIVVKTENILINSGYGRALWLQSTEDPRYVALYGHTSKLFVKVGTVVERGMIIANGGKSGFVIAIRPGDGSHLHFGLQLDGKWIDPLPLMDLGTPRVVTAEPAEPVPAAPSAPVKVIVQDGNPKYENYTLKKGDTLYAIAKKKLGDANKWRDLQYYNRDIIPDPKKMPVGLVIRIPSALKK